MPVTSEQILQANAQYASAMAAQYQHASMIGSGMPLAESITGGAMNYGSAVGGPLAAVGLGIAGLDPVSLGLRAGMGASRLGLGFGAAGAVGLGVAGLTGGALMGAGYAANQFIGGAQQQQAFNSSMNSVFRFANPYGGHGFGRQGLGDIGGMLRQMSTEQGPAGQMIGFEELGRLASNMGRMGMAQGVRDAKEFSDKFREMVKTVKQIAESMGTSLEEAQKMMSAMRSSGVFGQNQAAQFAQRVRLGAAAGGMATSELTGMMSVGSQISRMVGGRGRAGAAGGIETITNIGVAQQMGLISEEDIYNVTGLTGAEGRRAMATRQMEQSAQFLRGGLGRRFLASIAGKNGSLDAASVEEYLAGSVGTERTIEMYNRNLSRVGRADFIRNEGRLRGAALEQFGGLAPMIAMKSWLDERGLNVNEDNDRAMIFMQRQLGMGNDEAEMMLRQVRELPNLMRQRRFAAGDDDYMQRMAVKKSQSGLSGIKHKFEKARADVNAVLQQAGAEFYDSMSEGIEQFVNRLTDSYVKETRTDVAGAFRSMMSGGALGTAAASTTFGVGSSFRSKGVTGTKLFGSPGMSDMDIFQKKDAGAFARAGFGFTGGDLTAHLANVDQIVGAVRSGGTGLAGREGIQALGSSARGAFLDALGAGGIRGQGMDRLASFGAFLQSQAKAGNTALGSLAARYAGATELERAQIFAAFSGEGGAGIDQRSSFNAPELRGIYGVSGMLTAGAGAETVGAALGGGVRFRAGESELTTLRRMRSSPAADRAAGAFLMSDSGRDLIGKMMSDSQATRASALEGVQQEISKLIDKSDRSIEENGRLRGLRASLFAQKLTELEVNGATPEQIDAEAKRLAQEHGLSPEDVKASAATIGELAEHNRRTARSAAGERFGEEARRNLAGLQRGGLVTGSGTNLTLNAANASKLGAGASAQAFLSAMVEAQSAMAQMGPGKSDAETDALFGRTNRAAQSMDAAMRGMSVSEQRALARNLVGVSGTEDARAELGRSAAIGEHITAAGKRGKGGALSGAADVLGVNLSRDQVQRMLGDKGDVSGVAQAIANELGVGGNAAFIKQLTGSLGDIQGGRVGAGAVGLKGLLDDESVQKARKVQQEQADKFDPNKNLDKIQENTKTMADNAKLMVSSLNTMTERMQKNAEDWNPFS